MRRYLENLAQGLAGIGIRAPLLVIASNGGVVGARAAGEKPVYAVQSGPSAGVAGAARLGRVAETRNLIAFDMGGTTAKASLVEDGRVSLTSEYEFREGISTPSRFIKAGGYMHGLPAAASGRRQRRRAVRDLAPDQEEEQDTEGEVEAAEADEGEQHGPRRHGGARAVRGTEDAEDEPRLAAELGGHPPHGVGDVG